MRSITTILDFRQTEGQPQIFCTVTSNQSSWILLPSSLVLSQGWGLIDLLLRASNDTNDPTELAQFALKGVAKAALYCAHGTPSST
jgi:hypothetical protein